MSRQNLAALAAAAYILTIYAANAAIAVFGVIPIGLGLSAPAGVLFAGLAFSLRDAVQELGGRRSVLITIIAGGLFSALLGANLAIASAAAFLMSELADFAIYTPLRGRSWAGAVIASNTVGAALDSAIFLALAYGSLDFFWGQVLGKTYSTVLVMVIIVIYRWLRPTAQEVLA